MKKTKAMSTATQGSAWNDLRNVHNRVLIPSSLLRSLTRRATRNNLRNPIEASLSGFIEASENLVEHVQKVSVGRGLVVELHGEGGGV